MFAVAAATPCETRGVTVDAPFEAVLEQVFELAVRGTVLGVEIRAGTVRAGDSLSVPRVDGGVRTIEVRAVEYIDRRHPPPPHMRVGLVVRGIRADEVAIGGTIRGTLPR